MPQAQNSRFLDAGPIQIVYGLIVLWRIRSEEVKTIKHLNLV
jgi:hypothetical protein